VTLVNNPPILNRQGSVCNNARRAEAVTLGAAGSARENGNHDHALTVMFMLGP
jgi:hypothetical protein